MRITIAMVLAVACLLQISADCAIKEITTATEEQQRITLDDGSGSTITVDADSSLREYKVGLAYYFELLKGRASFDLHSNPKRRVEVFVDGGALRDIGTSFAIAYKSGGDVLITVKTGIVRLTVPHASPQFISQNEQATIHQGVSVRRLPPEEVASEVSLRHETLQTPLMSVEAIVRQLNAHNRPQIEVMDPTISGMAIGGTFSTSSPADFVIQLTRVDPRIKVVRCRKVSGDLALRVYKSGSKSVPIATAHNCLPEQPRSH